MSGLNTLSPIEFRDFIASVADIPSEVVVVDAWGGAEIEVRGMDGNAQAAHMERLSRNGGKIDWQKLNPSLLRDTCFIPARDHTGAILEGRSGDKLFDGWSDEQVNSKAAAALQLLARTAQRLSGLEVQADEGDDDDEDDA